MILNKFQNINNILIIRLSSIGDIILTTPVVSVLRKYFPYAGIDFLVAKQFAEILEFNPNIDRIIQYDKSLSLREILNEQKRLKYQLKNHCYDLIIDLQNNLRSHIFSKSLSKNVLRFDKQRLQKILLVYFKIRVDKTIELIPDRYLKTIGYSDFDDASLRLEFWLPSEKESRTYLSQRKSDDVLRIGIAPGAYHSTKRWGAEYFIKLIKLLKRHYNCEICLFGGVGDKEICSFIIQSLDFEVKDFSGTNSLIKTATEINNCSLLITNDTGVMHIASARQVPVVAIFGSTTLDFGFAPYKVRHKIAEVMLKCRPCTHIGREKCPKAHFNCMRLVLPEYVFSLAKDLLER